MPFLFNLNIYILITFAQYNNSKIDNNNKCRHVSDEFNKDLAFFACLHHACNTNFVRIQNGELKYLISESLQTIT